jgi:hypothetical protein
MPKNTSERFVAFLAGASLEEADHAWGAYTGDPDGDFAQRVRDAGEALKDRPAEVVALAGLDNAARAKVAAARFKQD